MCTHTSVCVLSTVCMSREYVHAGFSVHGGNCVHAVNSVHVACVTRVRTMALQSRRSILNSGKSHAVLLILCRALNSA